MDKPKIEDVFVTTVDDVQAYMDARNSLNESLRSAFISLAHCRHTLGAHRVGLAQIPTRMTASKGIFGDANDDGTNTLVIRHTDAHLAASEKKASNSITDVGGGERTTTAQATTSRTIEPPIEDFGGGILAELAAKYDCAIPSATEDDIDSIKPAQNPALWFGSEASISNVQTEFQNVIELILQVVNTQQRAQKGISQYLKVNEKTAETVG